MGNFYAILCFFGAICGIRPITTLTSGATMEIIFLIVGGIVLFILFRFFIGQAKGFDDPRPMSNQHLLSAIAGQADCLEKISSSPYETQKMPSIVELGKKRRNYMARLCLELLSRDTAENEIYPGASKGPKFPEAAQYAKELEATGVSKENSAVRSVKEELFAPSGATYPSRWEI